MDIPKDVQVAKCEFTPEPQPVIPEPMTFAAESKLEEAAKLIAESQRPYLYFGGGIIAGKASEQLMALA